MYVLVLSLGDPVSRTFLDLLKEVPLVETRGKVEIRKYRDLPVVVHRGDSTEFDREDVLAGLGRYAVFISRHEMSNPRPIFTVHTPGTWPDVSVSNPHLVSAVFRALLDLLLVLGRPVSRAWLTAFRWLVDVLPQMVLQGVAGRVYVVADGPSALRPSA